MKSPSKKASKRLDNRGLSLVELLLAVVILGIIVSPLLHVFVTSAKTAKKSYDIGELTYTAQSVAETVEATDISSLGLLGAMTAENNVSGAYVPRDAADTANADRYTIRMTGLDGGKYDAVVTLTADALYAGENTVDVTQYTPMDSVFSQSGGGSDPDADGVAQLALMTAGFGEGAVSSAVSRAVDIDIKEYSGGSYQYSCTFHYSAKVTHDSDGDGTNTVSDISTDVGPITFYSGSMQDSDTKLASLYFFFKPFDQKPAAEPYHDVITINHDGSTPVSVFLAAQGDSLSSLYRVKLQLKDTVLNTSDVFCNVPKTQYSYWVFINNIWYYRSDYHSSLVSKAAVNRMYELTVDLCAPGTDDVLYTLTASKLD